MNKEFAGESGFTLIELLIVLVILAILAAIVVPKIMSSPHKAKIAAAKTQIRDFETALDLYKLQNGFYPTSSQGLEALVKKPAVPPIPKHYQKGGYLSYVPEDPWGNKYVYISPARHGGFEIISYGPTGEPGGKGRDASITSYNLH
ncbi:MAG: type II secretion system major pseudopilin GspG [bacterium]